MTRALTQVKRSEPAANAPAAQEPVQLEEAVGTPAYLQQKCSACGGSSSPPDDEEKPPVQRKGGNAVSARANSGGLHRIAAQGVADAHTPLPHAARIQAAFGRHDISNVRTRVGGAAEVASARMGANAYALGSTIGFRYMPDLRLAAHEAAHIVQQRKGVHLKNGVGTPGDQYERHADAVAERVVAGESVEAMLDGGSPATQSGSTRGIQAKCDCGTCPECEKDKKLQMERDAAATADEAPLQMEAADEEDTAAAAEGEDDLQMEADDDEVAAAAPEGDDELQMEASDEDEAEASASEGDDELQMECNACAAKQDDSLQMEAADEDTDADAEAGGEDELQMEAVDEDEAEDSALEGEDELQMECSACAAADDKALQLEAAAEDAAEDDQLQMEAADEEEAATEAAPDGDDELQMDVAVNATRLFEEGMESSVTDRDGGESTAKKQAAPEGNEKGKQKGKKKKEEKSEAPDEEKEEKAGGGSGGGGGGGADAPPAAPAAPAGHTNAAAGAGDATDAEADAAAGQHSAAKQNDADQQSACPGTSLAKCWDAKSEPPPEGTEETEQKDSKGGDSEGKGKDASPEQESNVDDCTEFNTKAGKEGSESADKGGPATEGGESVSTQAGTQSAAGARAGGGGGGGGGGGAPAPAAPAAPAMDGIAAQAESQRAEAVGRYAAAKTEIGGARAGTAPLRKGMDFVPTADESTDEASQRGESASRANRFFSEASDRIDSAVAFAQTSAPDRLGAQAESGKAQIAAAIETQKSAISGRIAAARRQARGSAARARGAVNAQADAFIAQASAKTATAIASLTAAHADAIVKLGQDETKTLQSINSKYTTGRTEMETLGTTMAGECTKLGESYAAVYKTFENCTEDAWYDGNLSQRRSEAQVNAARATAQGYADGLTEASKKQAADLARNGRKENRCAIIAQATASRGVLGTQLGKMIEALGDAMKGAVEQANGTRNSLLGSISSSLSSTLSQLDQQEREQRQSANDIGYAQQCAQEQTAHTVAAGLQQNVAQVAQAVQDALAQAHSTLSTAETPNPETLDKALTGVMGNLGGALDGMQGRVEGGLGEASQQLAGATQAGIAALEAVAQSNDQLASAKTDGFASSMGTIAATDNFAAQRKGFMQSADQTIAGGRQSMAAVLAAFKGACGKTLSSVDKSISDAKQKLETTLLENKAGVYCAIPEKADLAASKEEPAWKDILLIVLVIVVLVVLVIVTGGAAIAVAAAIGAAVAGLIAIGINVYNGQPWYKGVGKAMAIAAVGAAAGAAAAAAAAAVTTAGSITALIAVTGAELVAGSLATSALTAWDEGTNFLDVFKGDLKLSAIVTVVSMVVLKGGGAALRGAKKLKVKAPKVDVPTPPKPATPKAPKPKAEAPHAPKAEAPGAPKADAPSAPKAEAPAKPKADAPAPPKAEAPKPNAPDAPKPGGPDAPKADAPDAPKGDAPGAPKGDAPGAPKADAPDAPKTKDATPPKPEPESHVNADAQKIGIPPKKLKGEVGDLVKKADADPKNVTKPADPKMDAEIKVGPKEKPHKYRRNKKTRKACRNSVEVCDITIGKGANKTIDKALAKKAAAKKAAKKAAPKKAAPKKAAAAKKAAPKKAAVKKAAAKKPTLKKPAVKKPAIKKAPAKKPAVKKAPVKKPAVKKAPAKKATAKQKAPPREQQVMKKHRAGNQQVMSEGRRWNVPDGMDPKKIPATDPVGDTLEKLTKDANDRWKPSRHLSARERRAINRQLKKKVYWKANLLRAQAKGRWIEKQVKTGAKEAGLPLKWSGKGADVTDVATGLKYDIMSGTPSNIDLHAKRMSDVFFRMITFGKK